MKAAKGDGKKRGFFYHRITTSLGEYRSFYESEWAKRRVADCASNEPLSDSLLELLYAWRTLSASFRFPSQIAPLYKKFTDSFTATALRTRSEWVGALRLRLADRLRMLGRSNDLEFLVGLLADAEQDLVTLIPSIQQGVTSQEIWDGFIQEPQFQMTVAGIPKQTYAGLYFAFETFLLRALHLKDSSTQGMTTSDQRFVKAFRDAFGEPLTHDCWTGPSAVRIRETRHAIVHNGARMTPALRNYRSRLPIDNGNLSIVAQHVTELHGELRPKVDRILSVFVQLT